MALNLGKRSENIILYGVALVVVSLTTLALSSAGIMDAASVKYIAALLILGLYVVAPYRLFSKGRLLLTVGLVFFPVTISVGGKDAMTTGSLVILLLAGGWAARSLVSARAPRRIDKGIWIGLLVIIAFAGVWQAPRSFLGPEIRHFINFFSSVVLFLLLINAPRLAGVNRVALAWGLATLMVWMNLIQTFIGMLIFYRPHLGNLFTVFLTRMQEELTATETLDYIRMRSLVVNTESVGEILAMLCPFVLYRVFEGSRKYWIVYGVIAIGLLLSNTRSGIALFAVLSVLMVLLYGFRLRWLEVLALGVGLPVALIALIGMKPGFLEDVASRFLIVWETIQTGGGFVEIMQRDWVWYDAWNVTVGTLSMFGHGPAPSRILELNPLNMHCLYMTLVFQFGIIGGALYLSLFLYILFRLLVPRRRMIMRLRNLRTTCALSLACFLVNEVKFEFNRGDSYQQIVWAMMAMFYLIAQATRDEFVEFVHRGQLAPEAPGSEEQTEGAPKGAPPAEVPAP